MADSEWQVESTEPLTPQGASDWQVESTAPLAKPKPVSQGLGLAEGFVRPLDKFWQRVEGLPGAKTVMDAAGQAFPAFDMARQAEHGLIREQAIPAMDRAAQRYTPGGAGKLAGNIGLGVATAPAGLIGGGALMGAALSDAPEGDYAGLAKDTLTGAVTSKLGGEAINAVTKGATNAIAKAVTANPSAKAMINKLAQAKDAAYDAVKKTGMTFTPQSLAGLKANMEQEAANFGITRAGHPKAFDAMDTFFNRFDPEAPGATDPATLQHLDDARQTLAGTRGDTAKETAGAQIMAQQADKFFDNLDPSQVRIPFQNAASRAGQIQQAQVALAQARQANKAFRNVSLIAQKAASAQQKAQQYVGLGSDRKTVQALRPLVDQDPSNTRNIQRFLSLDENDLLTKIVNGGPLQKAARYVAGVAAPTPYKAPFYLAGLLTGHIGADALASGIGLTAKLAADATTKRNVGTLIDIMAHGGSKEAALAAQQLRATAAKNSNVGQWLQAAGKDVGEYIRTGGVAQAVQGRQAAQQGAQ